MSRYMCSPHSPRLSLARWLAMWGRYITSFYKPNESLSNENRHAYPMAKESLSNENRHAYPMAKESLLNEYFPPLSLLHRVACGRLRSLAVNSGPAGASLTV
eukprot:1179110-Prorocentrum_minimum.AAC.5